MGAVGHYRRAGIQGTHLGGTHDLPHLEGVAKLWRYDTVPAVGRDDSYVLYKLLFTLGAIRLAVYPILGV